MEQAEQQEATASPEQQPQQTAALSPERQKMADNIIAAASSQYEKRGQMIVGDENPVKKAGRVATELFFDVLTRFNSEGINIPKDVSRVVTLEIINDLLENAEQAGVIEVPDDDARQVMFMQALSEAGKEYVKKLNGQKKVGQLNESAARGYMQQQQPQQQPQESQGLIPQQQQPQRPQQQPQGLLQQMEQR